MTSPATLTLDQLNAATPEAFTQLLDGLYEHSPWVMRQAAKARPFASAAALKHALATSVRSAPHADQMALIRAHPELAGRAAIAGELTADSAGEQARAGLTQCTPEEFAHLQSLNTAYQERFGFPFIIAVRGPTGTGLTRHQIMAAVQARLRHSPDQEFDEALRQIDRIAEIRLSDRLPQASEFGTQIMQWAQDLAIHTDTEGQLTCTYLSPAHRACAAQLASWMQAAGFDAVRHDAVGNVIGTYRADPDMASPRLVVTGSHYDTVRNGGKYDGRLGILVGIALVGELYRQARRLPFDLEVVAFAEEEGVRFGSTFLGSSAYIGRFDQRLLETVDQDGIRMRDALRAAGLNPEAIAAQGLDTSRLAHYFEVHIEQGPVLLQRHLPVGVVTSIAGSVRRMLTLRGVASHAGTTPMDMRRDAACAAAQIVLAVEKRCAAAPSLVGTVGVLNVPAGSVNVIPGTCVLSLDIRAASDAVRDAAVSDLEQEIAAICAARGILVTTEELLRAPAAPCDAVHRQIWEQAIGERGLPVCALPSGAGHDAMKMAEAGGITMLFARCGNGGISHNPLEIMTADDAQLATELSLAFVQQLARTA